MKKIATLTTLGVIFALTALPALALTGSDIGLDYGTYTGLGTKDLRAGIMSIVNVLLGFLGIIAIVIVLYGGFVWMTSGGSPEKIKSARMTLVWAVLGMAVIFLSYAAVDFVLKAFGV